MARSGVVTEYWLFFGIDLTVLNSIQAWSLWSKKGAHLDLQWAIARRGPRISGASKFLQISEISEIRSSTLLRIFRSLCFSRDRGVFQRHNERKASPGRGLSGPGVLGPGLCTLEINAQSWLDRNPL